MDELGSVTLFDADSEELRELADLTGRKPRDVYRALFAGVVREKLSESRLAGPPPKYGDPDLATLTECAKAVGCSDATIRNMIRDGDLKVATELPGRGRMGAVRLFRISEAKTALAKRPNLGKRMVNRPRVRGFLFGGA